MLEKNGHFKMREENAIELIHLPQNALKNGHDRFHLHFKMPAENALERIHLPQNACKNSHVLHCE
jgi:hypothetical protein